MKKQSKTDWPRVDAMKDEDIDCSDIPELTDDFFAKATPVPAKQKRPAKKRERVDVGLSWKTCPKCGSLGGCFSFVSLPIIKGNIRIENADSFQCRVCHEEWEVKP